MSTRKNFYYDPAAQGYDPKIWHTLYGTPTVASGSLSLTDAAAIHTAQVSRGQYTFKVRMPAPVTGASFQFGLTLLNKASYLIFNITGTAFSARVSNGTNSTATSITWQTAWTNVDTRFTIRWEGGRASFFINDILYAVITDYVGVAPMSLFAQNLGDSGALIIGYVESIDVQDYEVLLGSDLIANITFPVLLLAPSVSDNVTITESLAFSIV